MTLRCTLRCFLGLPLLIAGAMRLIAADAPSGDDPPVRFGYTLAIVRNAGENDFRGAMRAYARMLGEVGVFRVSDQHHIFRSTEEMEQMLASGEVEIVGGSSLEILALPVVLVEPPYLTAAAEGTIGVEYLLLTHEDSTLRSLADLGGRRIALLDSATGSLARPWLEQMLHEARLPASAWHFREVKPMAKPSLAALPVFFRQIDACVVTAANLKTLAELNPQLARKLRVIATSPSLVPILSAFRRGMPPARRQALNGAMEAVGTTPAGRQFLTLFQTDSLRFCTEADLAPTRELFAALRSAPSPALPAASAEKSPP